MDAKAKFLIKWYGKEGTVKAMNKIRRANKNNCRTVIKMRDVQNVMDYEVENAEFNQVFIIPSDIFRFRSLRKTSILICLTFFMTSYLYMGPIFSIGSLSVNPFLSQVILSISELLAYPASLYFVDRISRRKSGIVCFGISSVLFIVLIFVQKP